MVHGWEIEGKITNTPALFLEEIKLSFKGNSQRTSFCKSCPILLCVVSRLLESKAGLKKGVPRTWETWLEVSSGAGRLKKELNLDKTKLVSKARNVTLAGPGQRNHCLWLVLSVPLYTSAWLLGEPPRVCPGRTGGSERWSCTVPWRLFRGWAAASVHSNRQVHVR